MKPSTKRFASMVLSLIMIAIAMVVYFDFIRPAYDALDSVRGEAAVRAEVVREEEAAVGQVKKLVSTYRDASDLQSAVSIALPFSSDSATVMAQIESLARVHNVSLQSFSLGAPVIQNARDMRNASSVSPLVKPLGTLAFQIRFISTYEDFKRFLEGVETNLRVFDLTSLTFQPAGKARENLYAFDMAFSAYYQVK